MSSIESILGIPEGSGLDYVQRLEARIARSERQIQKYKHIVAEMTKVLSQYPEKRKLEEMLREVEE